ncbi:iron-siderophore ABC transporter substrate-binding protein [Rhizobium alvei]|uniref:Iron-siderophore ABC transporter substrate-binding protein n=2 Tax=Rhizobium alvei TaxID=1132659 RepID=A0ABT8YSH1_9HYPH|nr:iron-siderophore ABC transporter substrate-binding protein [Rhizobium alvei]MDO6966702.1 iron-siderophore ABC transporter substrate-binding protein [Rhizobium alvei]
MPARAGTRPLRIASLDYGIASTLLSLGAVPAAVADLADWGRWVVEPKMPDGVVDLGSALEVNVEVLTLLKPDLIVTTPYLDELLPVLERLGPVLRLSIYAPEAGPILDAAIKATGVLARAIDREADAMRFLDETEAFFDRCKARVNALSPPPLAFVNFMDTRHVRIYGNPGLFDNVLERIGIRNAWTEQSNFWGFQTIAIEELSRVKDRNARLAAFEPVPGDVLPTLSQSALWQALPFARPGHFTILKPALMFGMVNEARRFADLVMAMLEDDHAKL